MLQMIRDARLTSAELAAELGLSREQLDNRLALMGRQGYLQRDRPCSSTQKGCVCRCCPGPSCSNAGSTGRGYALTAKGRRVAEAKPSDLSRRQGEMKANATGEKPNLFLES